MFHPHYVSLKDGRAALIRPVEPGDADALIEHVNEIGAEQVYIMTEQLRMTADEEREMIRKIDLRQTLFLVAFVDRRLVGSADIERGRQLKNAHTASLGVAIRKPVRGLGLGKAILEDLIRWGKDQGIRKVTLGVFATNASAITLYRQLGFSEEGRLRGQVILGGVPVDEVLMARWL